MDRKLSMKREIMMQFTLFADRELAHRQNISKRHLHIAEVVHWIRVLSRMRFREQVVMRLQCDAITYRLGVVQDEIYDIEEKQHAVPCQST